MSVPYALIVLSLALFGPVCSQDLTVQFSPYLSQCEGAQFPFHPHALYDSTHPAFRRSSLGKVADGLGLLQKITKNATEAGWNSPYIPNLSQTNITRDDLQKLIKVVQLPYTIANRPVQERIGFEIPTAALGTLATDMCKLLQRHLAGVYKPFNCTEEQLQELDARLVYSDLLERHYTSLQAGQSGSLPGYQCQYWNTRGLNHCVSGSTLTQHEYTVHQQVVTPLYSQLCRCDVGPHYSPVCRVQVSA